MPATTDTIAAISSPPGRAARGLIRLSGPATRKILTCLFHPVPESPRRVVPARMAIGSGELPMLLARFEAPRSYTGQDMAELQLPGNPALLDRVLGRVLDEGARLAEPGEFTFRAFVNGRVDLTRAEGIAATITAVSDSQLEAAVLLREGRLGRLATDLVDRLAHLLALVEAGIDFVDQEDVVPISAGALADSLGPLQRRIEELLERSRAWSRIEELPQVVILGRPSTGKSTLFNALLGHRRAVISEIPGTTRDILREPMHLTDRAGRDIELMLVDLAGLDEPRTALDRQVQAAARRAIATADLLLMVDDAQAPPPPANDGGSDPSALAGSARCPVVSVRTKADLPPLPPPSSPAQPAVSIMEQGQGQARGLDHLRCAVVGALGGQGSGLGGQMLTLQPRHEHELRSAAEQLQHALSLLQLQDPDDGIEQIELVAGCMRSALDALANLGGQQSADDVIGRIFASFCIGK